MERTADEIDALLDEMDREHPLGGLNPSREQLRALLAADRNGPLHFLNLLAYHETARYPHGHELAERNLSGAEAYGLYGQVALHHVGKRGGRLHLYNDVEQTVIGQGGSWDQVAIMQYPNTDAFVDMVRDPEYLAGLVHRDAGLAATVVIVTRPLLPTT